MARRDYAKRAPRGKPRRKYKKRRSAKRKSSWRLWLITLLLLGGFIGFLHHLAGNKTRPHRLIVITKRVTPKRQGKIHKAPVTKFDFYTMLPKERVKILTPHVDEQYYLLVATVQAYTAADRLRAELSLLGFDIYLTKIVKDEVVWYQVNVGPYLTKAGALADQKQLLKNSVQSTLEQQKK